MFERLKSITTKLNLPVQEVTGENDKGQKIAVLGINHGPHRIGAIEQGIYTTIFYHIDIDAKDAELIAKQPPEVQQLLFALIEREMLEGRTGYAVVFDQSKKPPHLRRIAIEQRVITADEDPQTLQRFADGLQELVVTATRCGLILGQAFSEARTAAQTSASTYHPGMYV